jgi:iron(III) transport system substrate-binding protein
MTVSRLAGFALLACLTCVTARAKAEATLIMYCGVDENWCRVMTTEYQKQTGVAIELAMTGLSLLSPAPP